jgi:MinD-like ATPase involved in chromosome partitioning or flagellar assembly
MGAKGGDGVTTLACNFAVSLAQESGQSTLLIDLDLPLGDAALNLGVFAQYSAISALQNANRLDSSFLSTLLVKHSSGVSVLAAPGKFPPFPASNEAIDKLVAVARQGFDNVVIDMGSRHDLMETSIFKDGSTIYLVIQAGIAGLRNANRLISQYFTNEVPKLEIVINRYHSRSSNITDEQITRALTRPAQWKIPNDYAAVRRMQHTAVPLALEDSPISRLIRQMSRSACGLPPIQEKGLGEKKPAFSLRSLSRSISGRYSTSEKAEDIQQSWTAPGREDAGELPLPERQIAATESASQAEVSEENSDGYSDPNRQNEPETRTYLGATYQRGEDGNWHLIETEESAEEATSSTEEDVAAAVEPERPEISWSTPAAIDYGSALSLAQYMAMASAPGKFDFTPPIGDVLPAGVHTLTATFIPMDAERYTSVQASVELTVNKATPTIDWPATTSFSYGTAISASHLNATASVPGTFVYKPSAGAVLRAGVQPLTVTFTPEDTANYTQAHAAVWHTVTKATPIVTWPAPAPICRGTALSAAQLNATASVPGTFCYSFADGDVLAVGTYTLKTTFTPKDLNNYTSVQASVSLTVTKARPVSAPSPASDSYGAAQVDVVFRPAPAEAVPTQGAAPVRQQMPVPETPAVAAKPPVETPAQSLVKAQNPKFNLGAGPDLDLMSKAVFPDGTTIYLVMQPGSSGQQDSKLLVSQFLAGVGPKPEIVMNRYGSRVLGDGEEQTSTGLAKSADRPIAWPLGRMVEEASKEQERSVKKRRFSLQGLGRSIFGRSSSGNTNEFTKLGLAQDREHPGVAPVAAAPVTGASAGQGEPETRIYKGATYARGADGQWHLQRHAAHPSAHHSTSETSASASPVVAKTAARARKAAAKAKPASRKAQAKTKAKPSVKATPVPAGKAAPKAKPASRKTPANTKAMPQAKAAPVPAGKVAPKAKPATRKASTKASAKAKVAQSAVKQDALKTATNQ